MVISEGNRCLELQGDIFVDFTDGLRMATHSGFNAKEALDAAQNTRVACGEQSIEVSQTIVMAVDEV